MLTNLHVWYSLKATNWYNYVKLHSSHIHTVMGPQLCRKWPRGIDYLYCSLHTHTCIKENQASYTLTLTFGGTSTLHLLGVLSDAELLGVSLKQYNYSYHH